MRCFERLGNGELSPDQTIQIASQAIAATETLSWAMPLALGLWMNKRYADALEALQRPGVEAACGHMAYFHSLVGMVARQIDGNHHLARQAYERALQIEPDRYDTLYNANLLKDDQPEAGNYRRVWQSIQLCFNMAQLWG